MSASKVKYRTFDVFQQRKPRIVKGESVANFHRVGRVEAYTGSHAIELARNWPVFKRGQELGKYPVVSEASNPILH
jgi:1,2-phenylacetyl-CoA epoxidase PaaB subunit